MNKIFMNRLTMLAVTLMASMACFAQGKLATGGPGPGKQVGDPVYFQGVAYEVTEVISGTTYYKLKAVGFEPNLINSPELMTDDLNNVLTIQHFLPASTDGKTWGFIVTGVDANAFSAAKLSAANVSSGLIGQIKTLVIDYKGDEPTASQNGGSNGVILPTSGSTFAGLTALTAVESLTPGAKVVDISEDSFADNVYDKALLTVPEDDIPDYCAADGWTYFYKVSDGNVIKGDTDGDGKVNIFDYTTVLEAFLYSDPYDPTYDMDGDGTVNIFDAQLILDIYFAW